MGVEAVGVGVLQAGAHPQVSLRRLACTMAAGTWPVPSQDCLQTEPKKLQGASLSPFHGGRGQRAPLTHTCLPDPEHP